VYHLDTLNNILCFTILYAHAYSCLNSKLNVRILESVVDN